ncbi:MAG TPA: alcohol dehydrogenase catalytic domain-containing protein [Candidatus Hydrogenedentes bacterium]|nr:alcohol dehydrogenase catalytic domain-containing protein [Candidatus Hydrogenedentota bacterium]HOH49522.1 alcohol dehydrogenase catalytic domain-containing protein [Candidatus Hydrogenedentota bacterium]
MKALVFDGTPRVEELPAPEPGPGEALVRVLSAGVCNTDLEICRGYMDFHGVLGHEFVGLVEKTPTRALEGKRVVGEINCVCHRCEWCRMEMFHHCAARTVLGIAGRPGAFAEYLTLPEENLHPVPGNIRDDVAVFTEPLAAAFRILEQVPVGPADRVVVLGDGKLGQLCAQVLATRTRNLVCAGRHRWKLDLLAARGVAVCLEDEPVAPGADLVVEATGRPEGLARALELVRPEGTLVLKSTVAETIPLASVLAVVNEIRIVGSRCGPFRPALAALAAGEVEVRPMITEAYDLAEGVTALARARDPGVMKVLLRM